MVGGGPAGSTVAWLLCLAHMDVVVLDSRPFPREKVCAGWITPAVIDLLEIDIEEYGRLYTLQPFTSFRTGLIGGKEEVETDYGSVVSYGVRRWEFDHHLLMRSGAHLRLGEGVTKLRRSGGKWLINGVVSAPMIVGAGGHFCPVARHLGTAPGGKENVVAAREAEFEMTEEQSKRCRIRPETPELFFCPDLKGYGWCIRKGRFLNIGLGREDKSGLGDHLSDFLGFLREKGKVEGDMIPNRFNGHAYLIHGRSNRPVVHDGALLIGDAAGVAFPGSGEGILPAVESAFMAAEVIIAAAGDYSSGRLESYREKLITRFGGTGTKFMERLVTVKVRRALAPVLLANRLFSRHILLDRWFLHRHLPPLQAAPHGHTRPTVKNSSTDHPGM